MGHCTVSAWKLKTHQNYIKKSAPKNSTYNMNMEEKTSVSKNLELHILQWYKHVQKKVIAFEN